MPSIMRTQEPEKSTEAHFESKTKKGLYQFRGYRHRSGGFGQKNTEAR
jgi:hypothetical protein